MGLEANKRLAWALHVLVSVYWRHEEIFRCGSATTGSALWLPKAGPPSRQKKNNLTLLVLFSKFNTKRKIQFDKDSRYNVPPGLLLDLLYWLSRRKKLQLVGAFMGKIRRNYTIFYVLNKYQRLFSTVQKPKDIQ